MTTRLITAGAVLVLAIVFGFIFWNQFSSNQQQLAGNNNPTSQTTNNSSSNNSNVSQSTPDTTTSIESDLNSVDINGIDSDSSQFSTSLNGF